MKQEFTNVANVADICKLASITDIFST